MSTPLQMSFRNLDSTPALEEEIKSRVTKLERLYDRISSIEVLVDVPHRHHTKGRQYHVRITLHVPGDLLTVSRHSEEDHSNEDLVAAISNAFKASWRMLHDWVDKNTDRRTDARTG